MNARENRPSTGQPAIGVMVLNRDGNHWLSPLYDSLRAQTYPHVRVYLVDNASTDGSVETTLSQHPEVTVIRLSKNLGYCMAYNTAMPYAFADGCDWVVWANNDILLEPGCLGELASSIMTDLQIGVVGPAFLAWDNDTPNYYMVGNHQQALSAMQRMSAELFDVDWVEGSFLMVSRMCVEDTGPLDPYLFFYWEEADFCRRASLKGWRVVLAPRALARHYAAGSFGADKQNRALANFLQTRNYYIYQLANPRQSFARNLADAMHLLLVQLKASILVKRSGPASVQELKTFAAVMRELWTIKAKWERDRTGGRPPLRSSEYADVSAEVHCASR